MGTLYLVRHGQASFGAANYDQLSPLGVQQCQRLGAYFAGKRRRFAAVYTGTLQRQIQSWDALADGMGQGLGQRQPTLQLPGLNEYDSHAVIAAVHPQPLPKADTPEAYRQHFRILRDGLAAWMAGRAQPQGMPSYADFVAGIHDALARVRAQADGDVLMVSSGGPISTVVAQVLGAPAETSIALNLRIRNSAVSEFAVNPKQLALVTFNTLPHLDADEHASWVTHT